MALIWRAPVQINQGFEIIIDGVPRTFRDRRDIAYEAARFAKIRAPADRVEILDCSAGMKMAVQEDGPIG